MLLRRACPEERDGDDSRDDQQLGHIEDTRAHADQQVADEQHPDVGDDHAHDEGVGDLGVLFHELRAGRQPLRHEPAGEDGCRRAAGDAEGEQGDQRTAHARVVGAFRHEDAFHGAFAVAVGVLVPPLGLIVGDERGHAAPRTGERADEGPDGRGHGEQLQMSEDIGDGELEGVRLPLHLDDILLVGFQHDEHLGEREQADHECDHVEALHQIETAEGEPGHTHHRVKAHRAQGQPDGSAEQPLGDIAGEHRRQRGQAEQSHPEKGLGAELQGHDGQRLKEQHEYDGPENAAEDRSDQGDVTSFLGPALHDQRIAVQRGGDGPRRSRRIDEDGGVGPAVHGPAEHAAEPDKRHVRGHGKGEGDKQGHGRYGGDAGKHTADDADDEPDEHHQQIHGEHGARRAPHNILKHGRDCIHRTSLRKEGGPGSGPKPLRRAGYLLCVF